MLAVYTRLSREDDSSNSIKNQLRESQQYIKDNSITEYKVYNEGEGFSGTSRIKERPQLNQMMQDIENGIITSVWMRKQDRLARLGTTVLKFADEIIKNDIYLYFGDKGHVDLTDPIEMFNLTVMAGVDALKPAQQAKATKIAIRDNFIEGLSHGKQTYGFTKGKDRRIIIDEDEAEVIRLIFNLSLEGNGTKKIADILNEKKIMTQYAKIAERFESENIPLDLSPISPTYRVKNKYTGERTTLNKADSIWKPGTIYGILTNKSYMGVRTAKEKRGDKVTITEYNNLPIIVEPHLFVKVQENLKSNRNYSGKKVEYRFLLKGLLVCGKCGRNYYGRFKPPKKGKGYNDENYYMCSSKRFKALNCGNRSISIPYLETFVIKHLFESKDLLEHLKRLEREDNSLNELKKELGQVQTNLDKEVKKAERLADLLINDELGNDQLFIGKYNQSKTQISAYKERLRAIEQRISERTNNDRIKAYTDELDSVDLTNFTSLKASIHKIIKGIEIHSKTDVKDNLYYIIKTEYNGYDEVSIFSTIQPYKSWLHLSKSYTEKVRDDEEFSTIELNDGKEVYISNLYDDRFKDEEGNTIGIVNERGLDPIYIDKTDLIHFN